MEWQATMLREKQSPTIFSPVLSEVRSDSSCEWLKSGRENRPPPRPLTVALFCSDGNRRSCTTRNSTVILTLLRRQTRKRNTHDTGLPGDVRLESRQNQTNFRRIVTWDARRLHGGDNGSSATAGHRCTAPDVLAIVLCLVARHMPGHARDSEENQDLVALGAKKAEGGRRTINPPRYFSCSCLRILTRSRERNRHNTSRVINPIARAIEVSHAG